MQAAILATDGFEDAELNYPMWRLEEMDVTVTLATPEGEPIEGKHGYRYEGDAPIVDVHADEVHCLVLPGGRSPERLREDAPVAVDVTRRCVEGDAVVAAICHGPQLLASADLLDGRQVACYPGIADDVEHAGATYVDEPVVVDGTIVTSRLPEDLPAFMRETTTKLQRVLAKDV